MVRETKAIYCSSFQTISNWAATDRFGETGAMPSHHLAPHLCQLKRTITFKVFPNIKPKLALELNNSCLGGSR